MSKVNTDRSIDGEPLDAIPMSFDRLFTADLDGSHFGVLSFTSESGLARFAICPICMEHLLQCLLETKRLQPNFFMEVDDG